MDKFRSEVNIPVSRDSRTFEQHRKDMLNKLERSYSKRDNTYTSDTTASTLMSEPGFNKTFRSHRDEWDEEVNRWIADTRSRWSEDMKRKRQSMFALEPVDEFDLDHWGNFSSLHQMDDPAVMMEQMERRMESLRQKMDSMTPYSSSTFGGPTNTSMRSSATSRITSSTSVSNSADPRGTITKSNVIEATKQTRTINGETTSTSGHSSMSASSTGGDGTRILQTTTPGTLIPQTSMSGGVMDFLKDAYELGDDGQVHFKVCFDCKNFAPDDIDVTTVDNRLTVNAKKTSISGTSSNAREFCRTIDLPRSIDHENFQCHLTEDGVLILDAPVKAPDYTSITFKEDRQLGIRPKPESELQNTLKTNSTPTLSVTGRSGPTILKDGANGRKLHLEVNVDPMYKAEELCVRVDANKIIVSGKHTNESNATAEFSQSYEIPETVDPFTVTAQLIGTSLIIEAPLLCTV